MPENKLNLDEVKEKGGIAIEIGKTILGVAIFVIIFRFFIVQPFYIIGNSMLPDFHQSEYLFIDEATYYFRNPARGEVIVFKHPEEQCTNFVEGNALLSKVMQGPCTSYIKRVIGLPGETVVIKDGTVSIINKEHPSGFTLNEKYIESGVKTLGNQSVTLADGEFYVLGDNREPGQSSDSRLWGPLKKQFITGKAFLRLLPISQIGLIETAKYN